MKIFGKLAERRRRKAHEAHIRERDRQKALTDQDVQGAVRDAATGQAGTQAGLVAGQR